MPSIRIPRARMLLAILPALLSPGRAAVAARPEATADTPFYATRFDKTPSEPALTALGRKLFFDRSLSASGRQACASCHDPAHAYGPADAKAVQPGGADMKLYGTRAVPSLRYLQNVPAFTEHYYEDDGNDSIDQGVTGGHTWDGRAQSLHDQAPLPLFSPVEMANADPAAVVAKVKAAPYAGQFRDTFGAAVFRDQTLAFKGVLLALEVFQQSPPDFYPYDSKYDAYLRGQAQLTPQEARGLALFNDPAKGNCALCHPSAVRGNAFPAFSDFGYVAVGVPRNRTVPANRDPAYHDLGLCGPLRTDLARRQEFCGMFRAPTLRNIALRKTFFHNGAFHSLEQVLHFYAERDTNPGKWYPRRADGSIDKFDDLPPQYRHNVSMDAPFGGKPGGKPALSEAEIRDIIVFLGTLTDGWRPPRQAAR